MAEALFHHISIFTWNIGNNLSNDPTSYTVGQTVFMHDYFPYLYMRRSGSVFRNMVTKFAAHIRVIVQ